MSVTEEPHVRTQPPLPQARKVQRTQIEQDVEELGFAFIRALRERGHTCHGVIFEIWETPKKLALEPFSCISVPKVDA